jgi:hypothetical protein
VIVCPLLEFTTLHTNTEHSPVQRPGCQRFDSRRQSCTARGSSRTLRCHEASKSAPRRLHLPRRPRASSNRCETDHWVSYDRKREKKKREKNSKEKRDFLSFCVVLLQFAACCAVGCVPRRVFRAEHVASFRLTRHMPDRFFIALCVRGAGCSFCLQAAHCDRG